MNSDRIRSVGLSALVVLSLIVVVAPATAAPTDHTGQPSVQTQPTTITGCTVIDQSGSYQLATNVSANGTCIEITASDVHFDGQGYTLEDTDSNSGGNGIEVGSDNGQLSNVTVTDVRLAGWAWGEFGSNAAAIRMQRVDDARITDVTVSGGDRGLRLRRVTNTTIENVDIDRVGNHAIYRDRSSNNNTLSSSSVTQANRRSLLVQSSSNNSFEDNELLSSGNDNVRLAGGSNWNTFVDNEVVGSGYLDPCISVGTTGSNLVFRNNTVGGCGGHGITLSQSGSNFLLVDNNVSGNNGHGIRLNRLTNATLRNNTALANGGHGINLQRSANHTVVDNYARENERFGINLYDVRGTTLRTNTVASNQNGGLRLVSGSANNTLVGNTVLNFPRPGVITFPTGIRLNTADDNELRDNTVENAYIGIEVNNSANGNTLVDNRVNNTDSALWTFVTANSNGTTVDSLDIGDSPAAGTTLSFSAYNASISPNTTAPANADATAVDRYVTVGRMGDGAFANLSVHYESGDVSGVNESLLALWVADGSGWTELEDSAVNTRAMTVTENLTTVGDASAVGVFATDSGESHAVDLPSTPTPTATESGSAQATGSTPATGSETATSGGNGPGFDAIAGVLALLACALLLRRES